MSDLLLLACRGCARLATWRGRRPIEGVGLCTHHLEISKCNMSPYYTWVSSRSSVASTTAMLSCATSLKQALQDFAHLRKVRIIDCELKIASPSSFVCPEWGGSQNPRFALFEVPESRNLILVYAEVGVRVVFRDVTGQVQEQT